MNSYKKSIEERLGELCEYFRHRRKHNPNPSTHRSDFNKYILIDMGKYKGYYYFIISLGTHPCAYILLNPSDKYFQVDYSNLTEIKCHGGVTYSENYLGTNEDEIVPKSEDVWIIGWDYAHIGDSFGFMKDGKVWEANMIQSEIFQVIDNYLLGQE